MQQEVLTCCVDDDDMHAYIYIYIYTSYDVVVCCNYS